MGLVADGNRGVTHAFPAWVFRAGVGAVIHRRIVDDLAVMEARIEDAPTGTGDDDIVGHGDIRPIAIEGVDPLEIRWEGQVRIGLPDDPVAVDNDVGGRSRISLHAVHMRAVPEYQVVVN